ncbi:probable ubiquitin-like-specific protease 2A [Contarinia nasturtii]|uniref:probable ubiquitin-like-specific protease 2A n=1 Tax=Contarinia nasturtii TaxID=265458 RepID=UPI0012D42C81|nr:probable ubiquitin-like-specific protease 2A [Contarinia nasturtii]
MTNRNQNSEVLLTYENIQITEDDLKCLKASKYFNDKIINFYLKYMYRTLLTVEQQSKVHIFDSFFAEALDQMDESRTIRWLRRVNIFEKDYLLIPVNVDEHWFIMVICYPMNVGFCHSSVLHRPRILTLDSMPHHSQDKMKTLIRLVHNFIRCACVVQLNMTAEQIGNLSIRMQNVNVDVKEQSNNFDCGIHLLLNAEKFLIDSFGISENVANAGVEFRLSQARAKRPAIRNLIRRLIEATEIENAVSKPSIA